jgi:hypothetical protein
MSLPILSPIIHFSLPMYLSVSSLAQWCSMYLLHRLLLPISSFSLPFFLWFSLSLNFCLNFSLLKSSYTKNFLFLSPPILLFFLSLYLCFSSPFFLYDPPSRSPPSPLFPSTPASPSGSLFSPYLSLLSFYVSLLLLSCSRSRSSIVYTLSLLLCFLLLPSSLLFLYSLIPIQVLSSKAFHFSFFF